MWALLGAGGLGLPDRPRTPQHEESGHTPSGCPKVFFLESWELQGPSDEPLKSTTTIYVKLTARPIWKYQLSKNLS